MWQTPQQAMSMSNAHTWNHGMWEIFSRPRELKRQHCSIYVRHWTSYVEDLMPTKWVSAWIDDFAQCKCSESWLHVFFTFLTHELIEDLAATGYPLHRNGFPSARVQNPRNRIGSPAHFSAHHQRIWACFMVYPSVASPSYRWSV